MFDSQSFTSEIITRTQNESQVLRPNPKLKSGDMIFDIYNNWNKTDKSVKELVNYKGMRKILTRNLNQYQECTSRNCLSCSYSEEQIKKKLQY